MCKFKSHSALKDNVHSEHAKGRAGGGASSKNAIKLFVSSPSSVLLQLETKLQIENTISEKLLTCHENYLDLHLNIDLQLLCGILSVNVANHL